MERERCDRAPAPPRRGAPNPETPARATGAAGAAFGHRFADVAVSAQPIVQRKRLAVPPLLAARSSAAAAAELGLSGAGGRLPHLDSIQRSFGRHDISGVEAHTGAAAADGAAAMSAEAFASGRQVAFARAPNLRTAAHEAAHVVQQRAGIQPATEADEAQHERHADAVADAAAQGRSSEALLDRYRAIAPPPGAPAPVQHMRVAVDRALVPILGIEFIQTDEHDEAGLHALLEQLAQFQQMARSPKLAQLAHALANQLQYAIDEGDFLRIVQRRPAPRESSHDDEPPPKRRPQSALNLLSQYGNDDEVSPKEKKKHKGPRREEPEAQPEQEAPRPPKLLVRGLVSAAYGQADSDDDESEHEEAPEVELPKPKPPAPPRLGSFEVQKGPLKTLAKQVQKTPTGQRLFTQAQTASEHFVVQKGDRGYTFPDYLAGPKRGDIITIAEQLILLHPDKAAQQLVMELTNLKNKLAFWRLDWAAAQGALSKEDFTRENEAVEYEGVCNVIQACKESPDWKEYNWADLEEETSSFEAFWQYLNEKKKWHLELYSKQWDDITSRRIQIPPPPD